MPVTQLPTPPSRADSANFAARSDALFTALPTFVNEINALQINTNAQTAANEAASQAAALAAAAARDAAISAWSASTAPTEQLSAISQSLHSGSIVKAIVYDTSKDSDGGAWRKRTTHTSWYTEALGFTGKWLGQKTNLAAAWATSGAAAGDGFQNTTDGKFYTLTGTSTASEIWRGNVREFPAVVAIVVESGRVVIYDLTQPTCPMWKSWTRSFITSIAARDGLILVGRSSSIGQGIFDFINAVEWAYTATQFVKGNSGFDTAAFNSGAGITTSVIRSGGIVNATVNDCAITVLDTAPIDAATGLPVPTIYAFTAGGVSRIADDGTVSSTVSNESQDFGTIHQGNVIASCASTANIGIDPFASALPAGGASAIGAYWGYVYGSTWNSARLPRPLNVLSRLAHDSFGGTNGLLRGRYNFASRGAGMAAAITNTYNSGWLVGDIRGAWLADTTAETISGSGELVTNGTFATDLAGWTPGTGWAFSAAAAKTAGTASNLTQTINTVVGRTYTFTFAATRSAGTLTVQAGGATVATIIAAGTSSVDFIATGATAALSFNADSTFAGTVDNISVKLAEPDRSVKNKGLIVNGSLTKTAVASAAALVAWSGFSASNYLEQPYNSDLDFGTGDFCVMGWVAIGVASTEQYHISRGAGGAGAFGIATSGGNWRVVCAATDVLVNTGAACTSGLYFVELLRIAGVLYLYANRVLVYSAANTANISNASAKTVVGAWYGYSSPCLGSMALWRISATIPSAEQSNHIYRTELPLFQSNAQCTIAGTSTAVTAMAYDEDTTLLHVGTSWGRSSFKDLLRVDSEATTTGSLTSLSASQGVIVTGGTSGKVYMPALLLRDELRRRTEARRALGKVPVFFDYTATASQTAFVVPKGYTVKALYKNGTLMRETTTGVYWTRSNDGFSETATLSVSASASDWISIMAVRS